MAARLASWLVRPWLLRTLFSEARLAVRLLREPLVPLVFKGLPVLALLYVISPIDFVPDVLPLLGQLDDLGIILAAVKTFVKLCPAAAVAFHNTAIAGRRTYSPMPASDYVIDAEYRAHR